MVDCGGLENRWPERARGFESHPLRHGDAHRATLTRPTRPANNPRPDVLGGWQSGRLRRLAKPLTGVFPVRGFESLPVRHVGRAALLLGAAALPGCVTSKLLVRSEPPGATVFLDGRRVGTTPYEESDPAYGTRRLQLELEGHRRLDQLIELDTPWYELWPIDFVAELLVPWTIHNEMAFSFSLAPGQPAPDDWAAAEEAARRADAVGDTVEGG